MERIYLDFNGSTPLSAPVAEVMHQLIDSAFGNPSSTHWAGVPARNAIDAARDQVAAMLECKADEIIFTSGGSEANNLALKGSFFARAKVEANHIVTTCIEHPAILAPCRFLENLGARVTYLPVDQTGRVNPQAVEAAIEDETYLVSVMHANNEVGTIQPLAEIAQITRNRGVLLHTDAAQSVGKIDTRVDELGVDLLSIAGQKVYAPKGIGVLYVRRGTRIESLLHGAGQEAGLRAGTESALLAAALGTACATAASESARAQMLKLRDLLWSGIKDAFGDDVVLNGHPQLRLPNTLNVGFLGRLGHEILALLPEVAASTGSACHAGVTEISPVLKAMGVPQDTAAGAVRFSLGVTTTEAQIRRVIERLQSIAQRRN
jgi:cysteine desulfurase